MPSRRLEDLHPLMQLKAGALLSLAKEEGISLLFYETYRTREDQAEKWAKGRVIVNGVWVIHDMKQVVTNAPPETSAHEFRYAFDCVPLTIDKTPWWDAPPGIWNRLYKLAERAGLDALGDPWGEYISWDKGHFQEPGWHYLKHLWDVAQISSGNI